MELRLYIGQILHVDVSLWSYQALVERIVLRFWKCATVEQNRLLVTSFIEYVQLTELRDYDRHYESMKALLDTCNKDIASPIGSPNAMAIALFLQYEMLWMRYEHEQDLAEDLIDEAESERQMEQLDNDYICELEALLAKLESNKVITWLVQSLRAEVLSELGSLYASRGRRGDQLRYAQCLYQAIEHSGDACLKLALMLLESTDLEFHFDTHEAQSDMPSSSKEEQVELSNRQYCGRFKIQTADSRQIETLLIASLRLGCSAAALPLCERYHTGYGLQSGLLFHLLDIAQLYKFQLFPPVQHN